MPVRAEDFAQMSHKTWTARDGAPQGVQALAQAPDGTLWIGTAGGLFNFDGFAFRPFHSPPGEAKMPAGNINVLHTTRDGALWVGMSQGVVRISDGHVKFFADAEGESISGVSMLAESPDGSVWCTPHGGLYRIAPDGSTHIESATIPASTSSVEGVFFDSQGTLWIGQRGKLYRRPRDATVFIETRVFVDFIFGFTEASDGSVWISDMDREHTVGRHQRVDSAGTLLSTTPDSVMADSILVAPDDSLVLATEGFGLRRYKSNEVADSGPITSDVPAFDAFTRDDGLPADQVRILLRDSDGNIWSGGRRGIDRFRPATLVAFLPDASKQDNSGWSVCANSKGEVWVIGAHALYKLYADTMQAFAHPGSALVCGREGGVSWVGGDRIWNEREGVMAPLPAIPGATPYAYRQIVEDSEHTLHVIVVDPDAVSGIWLYQHGLWSRLEVTAGWIPISEYVDSRNRLWLGRHKGRIQVPLEHREFLTGTPGLGNVYAFLETTHGFFAAGSNGIAVLSGDVFQTLKFADEDTAVSVGGLVESLDGDIWLNAARGIVHVPGVEVEKALRDPTHAMRSDLLNESEFVGPVDTLYRGNSARDSSGNLWFATLNGVFHIDPIHRVPNTHPPIVSVRSVTVDGAALPAGAAIGPKPQTLVIQYLGVNLSAPELVRYQYRLDGFDEEWQDAGSRTEAIYTQLPPGHYSFNVRASNGGNNWTSPVSMPSFTVIPASYQTIWFRVAMIALGLLLLFMAFALRLRAIARVINARAEARADERIRIARDLHDTLLQGVHGLALKVHVATQRLPAVSDSKPMLEQALSVADRMIVEGRDRLSGMRADQMTDAELVSAIDSVGRDLASTHPATHRITRVGRADMTLAPALIDEIFYIAREALTNAFRHANATEIDVELDYGRRVFLLSCADNGSGFDMSASERRGHFGLRGMAERAARLGAQLKCSSEPGKGTRIRIVLPASRAYRSASRWSRLVQRLKGTDELFLRGRRE
jgi:signal transduction histidine kinase/ligand-binding sensor domain-containing protein